MMPAAVKHREINVLVVPHWHSALLSALTLPAGAPSISKDPIMANLVKNETEDDLHRLERDIRQYKIEYEMYFGGGKKRPPAEIEWRIEQMVKRYGDRGAQLNYAQRFLYGNLVQAYVKLRDIFRKRLKKREEGGGERHFGSAARKIEAERAARQKAQVLPSVAVVCSNPEREPRKVEQIYNAFREAIERSGESTNALSRDQFEQFLRKKTEQLRKQKGSPAVEFVVSVEGGKAHLKARTRS